MASHGFFGYDYDPYDYYYYTAAAAPYNYPYGAYYEWQRAPTRRSQSHFGIFAGAGAEPAARDTKTSFSIPIHWIDSDPEPEPKPKRKAAPAMSAEEAAVGLQAAARGFLARKSVRAVRDVARQAERVLAKIASSEAEALVTDTGARLALGEELMRMVLRLDAVSGARGYRRRVTKRVLALQDAVDALQTNPAPAAAAVDEEEEEAAEADAPEATAVVEMAEEESTVTVTPPDAVQCGGVETAGDDTPTTQVEVDEAVAAAGEPEAEAGEGGEKEAVPGDANVDVDDEPEGSDAESEWEIVAEENEHSSAAVAAATSSDEQEPPASPLETTTRIAGLGAASDGVDVTKVMEMVAALCQQSAQQCAVIGALAERVDALERTVRRVEDACAQRSSD